ncbi:MAG: radical SAM protein, partial [Muribaculaceae bacterium]|nr:radical SAM protein [Muribaculaceae bacterium]
LFVGSVRRVSETGLNDNGFIVNDNIDEMEILRKLFISYKESPEYSLMILSTYSCNFSCWYCIQRHQNENLNESTIQKIEKHISKYLTENNIKSFQISWFGGEPLLNFKAIRKICTFAQKLCNKKGISYSSGITTNGSLITPYMAIEMKELGFKDFQITIDGIKDNHNKTRYNAVIPDSYSLILNNIKLLAETIPNVEITIRFNFTHQNLNDLIVDQLDSELNSVIDKVEVLFRKVWQELDSSELTNKVGIILKKFQDKGYKVLHDYDNFKLTSCYVEQTHYNAIFPDGTVDKCSNVDISETRGYLSDSGDIIWNTFPDENTVNIFNHPSDCAECPYLPLCMGPCPKHRKTYLFDGKIHCYVENKDRIFSDEIKNFSLLNLK